MSEFTVASSPTPTSLPLSPPSSTSQTPSASPSSFSQAEIFEKHGDIVNALQKQQIPSLVQNSIPPLSPTSPQPSKSAPTSKAGPDVSSNASLPNAWKIVGSPSRPHFVPQASDSGRSSNVTHEDDTNEYTVNKCFTPAKSNGLDCEEELDLGLSSDDAYFDGSGLIGTRRSSECRVLPAERVMQYQYNPDAKFATGNASAPGFYMDIPRHPAGRRGSVMEVGQNMGLSTSANASTSWGSLGVQWTAGPSMWNGATNGNGTKNLTAEGSPPPPPDEVSAMHSVPFSHFDDQFSGTSDSRVPIGSGPLVAGSTSVGVGSAYLSDEYDQIQKQQLRKAQSLSFAHGQQETDFFGTSKSTDAQFLNSSSNDDQADGTVARSSSLSSIPDFSDDLDTHRDATGLPEHPLPPSTTPSQLRGLESNFCQLLPSMTEEMEGAHDVDESDISPSNATYAAYTLPKMRSRSKSFASTYGMVNSASPSNSHSGSSPMNQIRPVNGSSPKHQPMYGSVTAPSSPYHQKPSMTSAASIWQDDAASAEISRQLSNMSAATHLNTLNAPNTQYRMPSTTPNEYNWLLTQSASNSSSQHAASLSIGMNGNGNGIDMFTSQTGNSSPEQLERVRIQRRYSLNPALSGGAQGGMTMNAGMEMRGVIGTDNVSGGHGMGTGSYGDYRYLESGQGLGMLNRSVQQEYAHLNQRRHSVAGPTLSFVNPSQSQYLSNALNALHLDDDLIYGNQQRHHGLSNSVEETDLNDYFDNDQPRAARVAAATACGNYGGILSNGMSNPNSIMSSMGGQGASMVQGHSHSASRDADAHLGQGVPLHAIRHHGPLYIIEFKAGRSDLFYLGPESVSQQVKKGDLVIVEADRGKDLGKVVNDNITPIEVQMLQQQRAEAAAVAEMGISIMPDGSVNRVIGAIPGSGGPVKELHPKRIYGLAQPAEVTMLVIKCQDEAKAILVCQTKVRQKNLPMEVVDAEYQWDRRKLTFYFIAEHRIDFRELVRDLFKIYKTRIWMCAVNPNASSNFGMNILNK